MKYKMFKEILLSRLKAEEKIAEKWEVSVTVVPGVNETKETLAFSEPSTNHRIGIGLSGLYGMYQKSNSFNSIIRSIYDVLNEGSDVMKDLVPAVKETIEDIENLKKHIIFQLVNTKLNESLLETIPNRSFHDLSIIYRLYLDLSDAAVDDAGVKSMIIDNGIMENFDLSEDELYELAMENTPRLCPVEEINLFPLFTVLTNMQNINGSAVVLYRDVLKNFAERHNSDVYILPSSIHEVLLMCETCIEDRSSLSERLTDIVRDVNDSDVAPYEVLSDHVYFYSREFDKIMSCT